MQVSILVFVELALDVPPRRTDSTSHIMFQSLFSWNLLLMMVVMFHEHRNQIVSILVFVELALDGR